MNLFFFKQRPFSVPLYYAFSIPLLEKNPINVLFAARGGERSQREASKALFVEIRIHFLFV